MEKAEAGISLLCQRSPSCSFFQGLWGRAAYFSALVPSVFSIKLPTPDFSFSKIGAEAKEAWPRVQHGLVSWSPAVRISASPFDKGQSLQVTEANTSRSGRKIIDHSGGCLKMKTCGMEGGSVEKGLPCPANMRLGIESAELLPALCSLCSALWDSRLFLTTR